MQTNHQLQARLLRHLINVDGKLDNSYAKRMFNHTASIGWFADYDVKSNTFNNNTPHAMLFDFVWAYWDAFNNTPSDQTVRTEIERNAELTIFEKKAILNALSEICVFHTNESDFEYLRRTLREEYIKTKALASVHNFTDEVKDAPQKAIKSLVARLTDLNATTADVSSTGNRSAWLPALVEQYRGVLLNGDDQHVGKLPFPFSQWNQVLGGLRKGELLVFAAAHNVGKSFLGHEVAYSLVEQGYTGVCAELEMLELQLMKRYAARLSNLPIMKIEQGKLTDHEKKILDASLTEISARAESNQLLFVSGDMCATPERLRHEIEQNFAAAPPGFILVDYLTGMDASRSKGLEGWESVKTVTKELKALALHFECPVITMIHLNRKKDVQYTSVEQLADIVIHCEMDDNDPYIPPTNRDDDWVGKPGVMKCFVERNRGGPKGMTFKVAVEFATSSIRQYGSLMSAHAVSQATRFGSAGSDGDDD